MTRKKPELDPEKILLEAIYLLNEEGIDSVTTRKIAARLNVQSPALYWHYKNKQELLSAIREYIILDCLKSLSAYDDSRWDLWLKYVSTTMRSVMKNYRDVNILLNIAPLTERTRTELIPLFYKPLLNYGVSESQAIDIVITVMSYTSGWVSYEQSAPVHAFMQSMLDIEKSFNFGLETILLGFQKRFSEHDFA